jgi:biopolymer transport protein ExbD
MAGLTQPLEFRRFLRSAPVAGFDFVPFLDAILLAMFIALNVSAFVIAPGTTIRLPESAAVEAPRESPTAVLTVDRNQLYFFQGVKLSPLTLESHLATFVEELNTDDGDDPSATLLIKADASISTNNLFGLMDLARRAGFSRIHLAAEPVQADSPALWENSLSPAD